jgi:lysophospholipid acyltransferase (LPLAT)-like uncharacterized protein
MREEKKYRVLGGILFYVLKILSWTLKIKIINESGVDFNEKNYIVGFWHNKLLIPSLTTRMLFKKRAVLISPSKDGELISVPLEKFGFEIIRGSSGEKAAYGLMALMRYLKKGYNIGTPLDGPKGPPYKVKPGLLYLAQKMGIPLLPVGGAYKRKWILRKTWDQFQIPLPFTQVVCILGKAIFLEKSESLDYKIEEMEEILNNLDQQSKNYF